MSSLELIAALSILAGSAVSQTWSSPPPICFAFNDQNTAASTSMIWVECSVGALTVHFTAPTSSVVERLDLPYPYASSYWFPGLGIPSYDLYATSALGGPLMGAPITSFNINIVDAGGPPPGAWPYWLHLLPLGGAVSFTGGASYALLVRLIPGYAGCSGYCVPVGFDNAGTQTLLYTGGSIACSQGVPTSGQLPFTFRFRGTSCGPGPPASVTFFGNPLCLGPAQIYSLPPVPPVLGSPWFLTALGSYNESAYLFWSIGVNQAGLPVPGTLCPLYLDPVSLEALALLGAEPLAFGTLSAPFQNWFSTTWGFLVPASPTLAGAILGVQALIVSPSGTVPLGGGVYGNVTNALQLTLGY